MKRLFSAIRTNILYGIVFLIPIAAFILVAYYFVGVWNEVLRPLSDQLGFTTLESRMLAVVLSLALLLFICFVIGGLIRTRFGTWTFEKFETRILNHLPGYGIIATLLRGFADEQNAYQPALVTLIRGGPAMLGFVMEDNGGSHLTVYVPAAPLMTVGQVYVVERVSIKLLEGSAIGAANCISQWGVGLNDFLGDAARPVSVPK